MKMCSFCKRAFIFQKIFILVLDIFLYRKNKISFTSHQLASAGARLRGGVWVVAGGGGGDGRRDWHGQGSRDGCGRRNVTALGSWDVLGG